MHNKSLCMCMHMDMDTCTGSMISCSVSLLRQGGAAAPSSGFGSALVLLCLQVLVMHHDLQPVVPVADSVIGAAG